MPCPKRFLVLGIVQPHYGSPPDFCLPIVEAKNVEQALERARKWGDDVGYFNDVEFVHAMDAEGLRALIEMLEDENKEPDVKEEDFHEVTSEAD